MSFGYRHRKVIILVVLIIFFSLLGGYYFFKGKNKSIDKVDKKKVLLSTKKEEKKVVVKEEIELYKVDIKGEVNNPGLYTLNKGSRVSDVINMAGGLTEYGDTTVINLSKKIKDEMVIIIYSHLEVEDFKKTKELEKQVVDACINNDGVNNDACIDSEETNSNTSSIININTASVEELSTLPGIGESKAESIIKYREEKGMFTSIEQLKEINGIGDSIFDKLKEYVIVQ